MALTTKHLFPNDTVLLLKCQDSGIRNPRETEYGAGEGDSPSQDLGTSASTSSGFVIIGSLIPGVLQYRGTSMEDIVNELKFGYTRNAENSSGSGDKLAVYQVDSSQLRQSFIEPEKLKLIDRPIQLNSWIKYNKEIGYVYDINVRLDVQLFGNHKYLTDLLDNEVELVPEFYRGLYVCYQGWIGVVTEVKQKLHLKYPTGVECYLTRNFNNGLYYQKSRSYINLGDHLSPSGDEIKHAEWIAGKEPSMISWFCLRYLNIGYAESTTAEVVGNEIKAVTVKWHSQISIGHPPNVIPPNEIISEEFKHLNKLTLPKKYDLRRGSHVKVQMGDTTESLDAAQLVEKLTKRDLIGNVDGKMKRKQPFPKQNVSRPTDTEHAEKVVEGKVILRNAVASVLWKNGTNSNVPVGELIQYFPPEGKSFPLTPGTEVRKPHINSHKGIVQTSHTEEGYVLINWFGESSGDVPVDLQFNKETVERISELDIVQMKAFPVGLIVICLKSSEPGVVVGTNLSNGKVKVYSRDEVKDLEVKELKAYEFSATFVNDTVSWIPFKKIQCFPNEKHICYSSSGELDLSADTLSISTSNSDGLKSFSILPKAPATHYGHKIADKFKFNQDCCDALERDITLFDENSLPKGIWVRAYSDSPNLYSVLVTGMQDSSFQSGLFELEMVLKSTYPNELPIVILINDNEFLRMDLRHVRENGLLDMEAIFRGISKSNMDLPFIVMQIRESVFGDICEEEDTEYDEYSYSQEIKMNIEKQNTIRSIIPYITHWLVKTPKNWENEVLHYYRLEVPRFVFSMKKWIQYSRIQFQLEFNNEDDETDKVKTDDTKYPSFLPFDTIMQAEIAKDLEDLSHAYNLMY